MKLTKNELKEIRDSLLDRICYLQALSVKFQDDNLCYSHSALNKIIARLAVVG